MNPAVVKLLAALAALVVAFGAGWKVCDWRATATANAEARQRLESADAQLRSMTAARDALAGQLTAKDDQHLKELQNAQAETSRLRDGIASGTYGLRIAARASSVSGCPQSAASTRVDSGEGAELAEPARRAYFALRDGIAITSNQLAACQDELRLRSGQPSVDQAR